MPRLPKTVDLGLPMKRYCLRGHDRYAPENMQWKKRTRNGVEYKVLQCGACRRKDNPKKGGCKPVRFCPRGHDKDAPGGSIWYTYKGKLRRNCAQCDKITRQLRKKTKPTKALLTHCLRGHELAKTGVWTSRMDGKGNLVPKRRCTECHRILTSRWDAKKRTPEKWAAMYQKAYDEMCAAIGRPFVKIPVKVVEPAPIEPPQFFSRLEKFLALPAPRLHRAAVFERKQIS